MAVKTKEEKSDKKSIPQREDIAPKDKWDVSCIYKDDAAWEADYKKAQEIIKEAPKFTGKLAGSADILYDCLETQTKLELICGNLYQYAKLNQDLDNRESKYQANTDRAAMLGSMAAAAFSYVEPELLKVDDKSLLELTESFPQKDIYDFYIKELIRSRRHIRSAEVEELLAQSAMISRGPGTIFTLLDDADLKYPSIKDEKGEEVQLTKQRFQKFMESPDQRVRRDAHNAFNSVYSEHINMLGATLSSAVNGDIFYARARKYESCLHMALDAHDIPVSVYHSLIKTTENNLTGFHKWIGLRKKILGLDEIYPYDIYNPLFPEQNFEVPYADAVKEVLSAVAPLGDEYGTNLRNGFKNNWVDIYETEGKTSGAYSWGNFDTHPFVLMNYNGTIGNMFTLAHEMGHAMHSFLSNSNQPYPKSQYATFVAEVASTLNEGLMLDYLLKKTTDKKQKLFLLNKHIDKTLGTYFHQVFFAEFELRIHEMVEKGDALSPDVACNIWIDLNNKYYGPELTLDELTRFKWARIPHYYRMYYVYQYATSYAASQAILDKFLSGEEGIIEKYLELLSSGGNDYPVNQLKKCGVDMTTSEPFKATIKLFDKLVDEVERLAS
ncbi:MAG: oligoendopeptidase F [Candidatus Zixiibacteriota bacterium]|nr:MAG: oligoendopeptidase F [candidate division Zixibacteria bacterium]